MVGRRRDVEEGSGVGGWGVDVGGSGVGGSGVRVGGGVAVGARVAVDVAVGRMVGVGVAAVGLQEVMLIKPRIPKKVKRIF